MDEIETIIQTEGGQVVICEWDNGGAWLKLSANHHGGIYTPLTRAEAKQLLAGLHAILAKEVTHDEICAKVFNDAFIKEQEPEVDLQTRWPMKNWKENKPTSPAAPQKGGAKCHRQNQQSD